jgi:hypothetical protein
MTMALTRVRWAWARKRADLYLPHVCVPACGFGSICSQLVAKNGSDVDHDYCVAKARTSIKQRSRDNAIDACVAWLLDFTQKWAWFITCNVWGLAAFAANWLPERAVLITTNVQGPRCRAEPLNGVT